VTGGARYRLKSHVFHKQKSINEKPTAGFNRVQATGLSLLTSFDFDHDAMSMDDTTNGNPRRIARIALDHYHQRLPLNKGKPKSNEWTVYAAIVAEEIGPEHDVWVVSCATGTKCTSSRNGHGDVLHDCHAEVLARRGLVRVLLKEVGSLYDQTETNHIPGKNNSHPGPSRSKGLLARIQSNLDTANHEQFILRSDVKLHLYVSDSPCGDASIYEVSEDPNRNDAAEPIDPSTTQDSTPCDASFQFTGAKIIVSAQDAGLMSVAPLLTVETPAETADSSSALICIAREANEQQLGCLRTKSGRSNLVQCRSTSHSCSDKLVRWSIAGWQGLMLSHWIPHPVRLSTVIVSRDPRGHANSQAEALQRAIADRVQAVWQSISSLEQQAARGESLLITSQTHPPTIPSVYVVDEVFESGKSQMSLKQSLQGTAAGSRKRKRDSSPEPDVKLSPCGLALNWQYTQQTESRGNRSRFEDIEVVAGARGLLNGKKPKGPNADFRKMGSRLSRRSFSEEAVVLMRKRETGNVAALTCGTDVQQVSDVSALLGTAKSYRSMKVKVGSSYMHELNRAMFARGPLAGWIRGSGCDLEDFPL
jgi:Adenosine-deaminase (editase) domain